MQKNELTEFPLLFLSLGLLINFFPLTAWGYLQKNFFSNFSTLTISLSMLLLPRCSNISNSCSNLLLKFEKLLIHYTKATQWFWATFKSTHTHSNYCSNHILYSYSLDYLFFISCLVCNVLCMLWSSLICEYSFWFLHGFV